MISTGEKVPVGVVVGATVGAAVGAVILVCLVVCLVQCCRRRRREFRAQPDLEQPFTFKESELVASPNVAATMDPRDGMGSSAYHRGPVPNVDSAATPPSVLAQAMSEQPSNKTRLGSILSWLDSSENPATLPGAAGDNSGDGTAVVGCLPGLRPDAAREADVRDLKKRLLGGMGYGGDSAGPPLDVKGIVFNRLPPSNCATPAGSTVADSVVSRARMSRSIPKPPKPENENAVGFNRTSHPGLPSQRVQQLVTVGASVRAGGITYTPLGSLARNSMGRAGLPAGIPEHMQLSNTPHQGVQSASSPSGTALPQSYPASSVPLQSVQSGVTLPSSVPPSSVPLQGVQSSNSFQSAQPAPGIQPGSALPESVSASSGPPAGSPPGNGHPLVLPFGSSILQDTTYPPGSANAPGLPPGTAHPQGGVLQSLAYPPGSAYPQGIPPGSAYPLGLPPGASYPQGLVWQGTPSLLAALPGPRWAEHPSAQYSPSMTLSTMGRELTEVPTPSLLAALPDSIFPVAFPYSPLYVPAASAALMQTPRLSSEQVVVVVEPAAVPPQPPSLLATADKAAEPELARQVDTGAVGGAERVSTEEEHPDVERDSAGSVISTGEPSAASAVRGSSEKRNSRPKTRRKK